MCIFSKEDFKKMNKTGNVVISKDTILKEDLYCKFLIIKNRAILYLNGYRILSKNGYYFDNASH